MCVSVMCVCVCRCVCVWCVCRVYMLFLYMCSVCVWLVRVAFILLQAWQVVSSQEHLSICLQIATEAKAEKKNAMLAQIYDELCRKAWAEAGLRGAMILNLARVVSNCFHCAWCSRLRH